MSGVGIAVGIAVDRRAGSVARSTEATLPLATTEEVPIPVIGGLA